VAFGVDIVFPSGAPWPMKMGTGFSACFFDTDTIDQLPDRRDVDIGAPASFLLSL
jgi:hypothetical protein